MAVRTKVKTCGRWGCKKQKKTMCRHTSGKKAGKWALHRACGLKKKS